MKKSIITSLIISSLITVPASAQRHREYTPSPVQGSAWNTPGNINPIIPGYFADPTIKKFGDTYYIYATTDGTGNGYGPAQVWMSKDFVNWKNFVMNWPTTEVVWAPDVVQQPNGKYRYYYCEPCNVNIGESDSPIGPWHNILGKENAVMVPDRYIHNVITLDPMLFKDETSSNSPQGGEYLYFTTWGIYKGFGCGVAKLKDGDYDIAALGKKYRDARRWNENRPYPIAADEFFTEKKLLLNDELKDIFEAPFVFKKDGIYYFTYSSGSCHTDTYRVQYATSKAGPMGPWEYKGAILTTNEDGTVHGPGHHSILEQDGNYYIVYHRHNIQKSVHGFNRQLCIDKLEFDDNGDIKPVVPTHNGVNPLLNSKFLIQNSKKNLAFGAKVTASSYYDDNFKPEYAVDDNNATLWKARNTTWDGRQQPEWIQIDLGKAQKFNEIWTQFEYATFFYQYKIETSLNGTDWTVYSDKNQNTMQGSPMIDKGACKARYIRISITDTQKNGHMPAIWNVKVWKKAPELPSTDVESNDGYPGMHKKDVNPDERVLNKTSFTLTASIAKDHKEPFDISEMDALSSANSAPFHFKANKPIRMRVKDGEWAMFFNGTQYLKSDETLPNVYRYNAPYTIIVRALSTKVGPVATLVSLSSANNDLATTEFRLGNDNQAGLVYHNGSFESYGAGKTVNESAGKWHTWYVTFDGWMERVYMDGKLIHEQNNFFMVRPKGHITIGADASGANNFMGYISYVRLLPTSMNEKDIEHFEETIKLPARLQSLGDDDFEEIDPDSKFVLNPDFTLQYQSKETVTLSNDKGNNFEEDPLNSGAQVLKEVKGDFALLATVDDMEGLSAHKVKAYNEGGIFVYDPAYELPNPFHESEDSEEQDDNGFAEMMQKGGLQGTLYQFGAFPLYNSGNMFTIVSHHFRPQFPNYKGYHFDKYIQFERRGNQLFVRSSADGKTWENTPGSPVEVTSESLKLGIYQTTYNDTKSWVKLSDIRIYAKPAVTNKGKK